MISCNIDRHEKRRDLRDPGSWKYFRIAEEIYKYSQNIHKSESKDILLVSYWLYKSEIFHKQLFGARILAFWKCFGQMITQNIAEISLDP